jgi:hypothetical protein
MLTTLRTTAMAALVASVSALAACADAGGTPPTAAPTVSTIEVSPPTATIPVFGTTSLTATPRDASGTAVNGRTMQWTTSNASVATVSGGVVTGVGPGTTTITAAADGKSGSANVTVTPLTPAIIAINAGDAQQGQPLATLPIKPVVVVRDASAQPVAGITVSFSVDSGGGTIQLPTATTAADGTASPGNWQLGAAEGRNVVRAQVAALAASVTFVATAVVTPVTVTTQTVGTNGGTITVVQPGSPLHNLSIRVPTGALRNTVPVTVSIRSALQTPLPQGVVPATPLLVIDANAASVSQPLLLRVALPEVAGKERIGIGRNALGELQVLPTVRSDESSITVALSELGATGPNTNSARSARTIDDPTPIEVLWATFTKVIIGGDQDTQFRPGVDDWDFARQPITSPANVSVPTVDPAESMLATSLWYFKERKTTDGKLWKRFREAGNIPESNRRGLRWVAVAAPVYSGFFQQSEMSDAIKAGIAENPRRAASAQLTSIKSSMSFFGSTPKPVPVLLFAGTSVDAPRAGVAFRTVGDVVELAIPDQPGQTFRAEFTEQGMKPFPVSTIGGGTFTVTSIGTAQAFMTEQTAALAAQWPRVVSGTIGNNEGWPGTQVRGRKTPTGIADLDATDLILLEPYDHWWRCAACLNSGYRATGIPDSEDRTLLFRTAGASGNGTFGELSTTLFSMSQYSANDIKPALEATVGFVLYQPGPGSSLGVARGQSWLDWKTVRYRQLQTTMTPREFEASKDTSVTFNVSAQNVPAGATYEWYYSSSSTETRTTTTTPMHTRVLSDPGPGKMVVTIVDGATGRAIGRDSTVFTLKAQKKWRLLTFQQTSLTNTFPANHQPAAPTWENARTTNELRDSIIARPAGATLTVFAFSDTLPRGFKRNDDTHVRAEMSGNGSSMYLTFPRGGGVLAEAVASNGEGTAPTLPANQYPFYFLNFMQQTGTTVVTYTGTAANWIRPMSRLIPQACDGPGTSDGGPFSLARSILEIHASTTSSTELAGTITFVTQAAAIELQATPTVCWWKPMAEVRRTFSFTAVRIP